MLDVHCIHANLPKTASRNDAILHEEPQIDKQQE